MKKLLLAFTCVSVLALSGCNTFRGVGEDVQAGGHGISHAASDTQEKM